MITEIEPPSVGEEEMIAAIREGSFRAVFGTDRNDWLRVCVHRNYGGEKDNIVIRYDALTRTQRETADAYKESLATGNGTRDERASDLGEAIVSHMRGYDVEKVVITGGKTHAYIFRPENKN